MADNADEFWTRIDAMSICMMTTHDGAQLRSRPMAAKVHQGQICFLTQADSPKTGEIADDDHVNLAFVDQSANDYVSVSGRARLSSDRSLIKTLWGPFADAWFEGDAETANVKVVSVDPESAQIWDGESNSIKAAWEIAKGIFTDVKPDMGEVRKVSL